MQSLRKRFQEDKTEDKTLRDKLQRPPSPVYSDLEREATFPQTRIDPSTLSNTQPARRSVDVMDAANNARRDVWKALDGGDGRTSMDSKRTSTDMNDAGRMSQGERRLPLEAERAGRVAPEYASRTRAGSVPRYAVPPGGEAARANAATATGRTSISNNGLSHDMTSPLSPSRNFSRKPVASPDRNSGSSTYRTRNVPGTDSTTQRVFHGIDQSRAPAPPPKDTPAVPPKSHRRSIDGSVMGGYTRIPSPAPVSKMDIFKPDGTLHDRYTTNTEDVERLGEKFARAVIHEKIAASVHNVITTAISREIHTHEIRQHVLPIVDKKYLPERHWIQTADGRFVEVDANQVETARERYAYATQVNESVSAVKIEGQPFDQTDDFPDHYFNMDSERQSNALH